MNGEPEYPHTCPRCSGKAYVGIHSVTCSNNRCTFHPRFVGASLSTQKLVEKAYALSDDILRQRRDPRAIVARDAIELAVAELLGDSR